MRRPCTTPGCRGKTEVGTNQKRCEACRAKARRRTDQERGSASARGYDARWSRGGAAYFQAHPYCVLNLDGCLREANVRDHWPKSRKQLLAEGVPDPDRWEYLRPVCRPCHSKATAQNQPGGWNKR